MQPITQLPALPRRAADAHKGTFGTVVVVGGSRGMSGAAALSGLSALRGGAGLVRVLVPAGVQGVVAGVHPCLMTQGLPEDAAGHLSPEAVAAIEAASRSATVLAIGPGMGQTPQMPDIVARLLRLPLPVVLDADGLNALAQCPADPLAGRSQPTILTPHPGEFARLTGRTTAEVQADRGALALGFARARGAVLLLKGSGTLVTDGTRLYRNSTGNPGMATAGSGDVLTGLIAALLAQGLEAFAAAQLGAHLHGRAGDLAAAEVGEVSLIATDLIAQLPGAFRSLPRPPGAA